MTTAPERFRGRWSGALVLTVIGVAAGFPGASIAQGRYLYVADVSGEWVALSGRDSTQLDVLARLPSSARIRYVGADPRDESASLVLRDPRTLARATVRCGARARCQEPVDVAALRFSQNHAASRAQAAGLYARLGDQESLRHRIRLVGARSEDRDLGLLVLAVDDSGLDLTGLISAAPPTAANLIARFCDLNETAIEDDCLTSRRQRPADCLLSHPRCRGTLRPGAYRVDLFARERAMLATVPVAAGFAVLVSADRRIETVTRRDAALGPLVAVRSEFTGEEWRGLVAAVAVGLAGGRP
ncbi:MAG: hypothetical protein ACT4P7_24025 [Gemmatimonadaceae bacterium]